MRRTRIAPVSAKRRRRDRHYQQARAAVWERSNGICQVRVAADCDRRMTEVHHIAGRGGDNPHRQSNLIGCCHWCHALIHAHPEWARKWGYMASRHGEVSA